MTNKTATHQNIFDTLNRYKRALDNRKKAYLDQAQHSETGSLIQTNAFDAAFTLEFMIASHQQLINYFDFLQTCNNRIANKALNDLIGSLSDNQDIHEMINSLQIKGIQDGKQVADELGDYFWWLFHLSRGAVIAALLVSIIGTPTALYLSGFPAVSLSKLSFLISLDPWLYIMPILAPLLTGSLGVTFFMSIPSECEKKQARLRSCVDELSSMNEEMYRSTSEHHPRIELKKTLRDNFFNRKNDPESRTLSDEVKDDYNLTLT